MALAETLTDDFSGASLDTAKWLDETTPGHGSQSGGTYSITTVLNDTSYWDIKSVNQYDLTGSFAKVQIVSAGDQTLSFSDTVLGCVIDGNNKIFWDISHGGISAHQIAAGVDTQLASASYVAATFAWLRIRESGGTTFWDYSSDGFAWTNLISAANPITMTSLQLELQVGSWGLEASHTGIFDNFNLGPPVPRLSSINPGLTWRRRYMRGERHGGLFPSPTSQASPLPVRVRADAMRRASYNPR